MMRGLYVALLVVLGGLFVVAIITQRPALDILASAVVMAWVASKVYG